MCSLKMFTNINTRFIIGIMEALNRAIRHFGSKAALAREIGFKPMAVRQWEVRGRVSINGAVLIEQATQGKVTREQLRPDVFSKAVA